MKKLMGKLTPLMAVVGLTVIIIACQKEASSKSNFIFKPAPSTDVVAKLAMNKFWKKIFCKSSPPIATTTWSSK